MHKIINEIYIHNSNKQRDVLPVRIDTNMITYFGIHGTEKDMNRSSELHLLITTMPQGQEI